MQYLLIIIERLVLLTTSSLSGPRLLVAVADSLAQLDRLETTIELTEHLPAYNFGVFELGVYKFVFGVVAVNWLVHVILCAFNTFTRELYFH